MVERHAAIGAQHTKAGGTKFLVRTWRLCLDPPALASRALFMLK